MRTGSKLGHVYVLLDERCCAVSYQDAHRQRCETVTVKPRAVVYFVRRVHDRLWAEAVPRLGVRVRVRVLMGMKSRNWDRIK